MTEISIYVEGGGNSAQQKAELRQGLDALLGRQKRAAQGKKVRWKLVCCGSRSEAFRAFRNASKQAPGSTAVLLVDSESPFSPAAGPARQAAQARVAHLAQRDGWDFDSLVAERVHLMVQCMEAWIVADPKALEAYYGRGFAPNQLPVRQNLEDEPKIDVYAKLKRATESSTKGAYGKIKHASQLLALIGPENVAQRYRHFSVLTDWLDEVIVAAA
ncbi:MAG TPA: DUF4276 family protein [Burkholderiaceae bacterium]|nr:DUF4276 family protein [Burkholderiaceae bacterium]